MSSDKTKSVGPAAALYTRRGVLGACLLAPALAGCGFQPLYGSSGFAGSAVAENMRAVDFAPIPGRVGQSVRNELIFKATGGREASAPKYRLEVALRETAQQLLVSTQGEAKGLMFGLDAEFKLINSADQKVLLSSKANGRAPYQSETSTFANLRARRDAEDRAARLVAESISSQVAAFLSQG
jgi:LPS-assembly lipoprotein